MGRAAAVTAVFFDVGETLVDETRVWEAWADRLRVPRFTFLGVLGGVIARGQDHRNVFDLLAPGFDPGVATDPPRLGPQDWYPDAAGCLARLREAGYLVGVAGNQPASTEQLLRDSHVGVDVLGSSGSWGFAKPDAGFFDRIVAAAGRDAAEVAYVGDRLDNDVLPAQEAGMVGVFLRRGPWAVLQAATPVAALAAVTIDSLDELPAALAR